MTITSPTSAAPLDPVRASTSALGTTRKQAASTEAAATTPRDVISLSSAAQAGSASSVAETGADLTTAEAQSQATDLRSQITQSRIGGQTLSASAQQNQAILSLLR